MLGQCEECNEGLMIPMADVTEVDYEDTTLVIHDHPYQICTHCNYIEYEDIEEAIEAAKSIYDEYGANEFEFQVSEGYQTISFDFPYEVEGVIAEALEIPENKKKSWGYAGAAGAAVVVLAGSLFLLKNRKRKKQP